MKPTSVTNACLAGGADRVVWGAGLFTLGRFADHVGLTEALSAAVPRSGERAPVHDRGAVLTHALLMLAGGGEACTDIEYRRAQRELFDEVASDSTLYRTLTGLGAGGAGAVLSAAAAVRSRLWADHDRGHLLAVDVDSTLVEVHSENKAGAAPNYKGGFGFHPMVCSAADGEPLWIKQRPGRRKRRGAQAANLTDLADLSGWPDRTRLIVCREPRHPGAQRTLFESDNFRYWRFLTDQTGDAVQLDRLMRSHADVENAVCRLKDSGLTRMPFTDWHANSAWAAMAMIGLALVGWFQNACLTGALRRAAPKRLRWQLWHLPALVCHSARRVLLRLPEQHPGAKALLDIAHPTSPEHQNQRQRHFRDAPAGTPTAPHHQTRRKAHPKHNQQNSGE